MAKKDNLTGDSFSSGGNLKNAREAYYKTKQSGASIKKQQETRDRLASKITTKTFGKPEESPRANFRGEWNYLQQKDKSVVDGSARARTQAIKKKLK